MSVFDSRPLSALAIFAVTLGFGLSTWEAEAACPSPYHDDDCDDPGSDVCHIDGTAWACYLDAADSFVTVVQDYSGDKDYEAWGEIDGVEFCCEVDDSEAVGGGPITLIKAWQTTATDWDTTINFTYDSGSNNLQSSDTHTLSAVADGLDGDDEIHGSECSDANYSEVLKGGDGNDYIYGGAGDDQLEGGAGINYMWGDEGNDTMIGDSNSDEQHGGEGDDILSSGAGEDFLYGDDGADTICGGLGTDYLFAGDTDNSSVDKLWGKSAADLIFCQSDETMWSSLSRNEGDVCDIAYELTAKPPACP